MTCFGWWWWGPEQLVQSTFSLSTSVMTSLQGTLKNDFKQNVMLGHMLECDQLVLIVVRRGSWCPIRVLTKIHTKSLVLCSLHEIWSSVLTCLFLNTWILSVSESMFHIYTEGWKCWETLTVYLVANLVVLLHHILSSLAFAIPLLLLLRSWCRYLLTPLVSAGWHSVLSVLTVCWSIGNVLLFAVGVCHKIKIVRKR